MLKRLLFWCVSLIMLAGMIHIATVFLVNRLNPASPLARLKTILPENGITYFSQRPGGKYLSGFADPSMAAYVCRYDISRQPVRFTGPAPSRYWSLTIYNQDGGNEFALNKSYSKNNRLDIILVSGKKEIDAPDKTIIFRKSGNRGFIILRVARSWQAYEARLKTLAAEMSCGPMSL